MSKITYTDKVALNQNPNVQDINKVNATDMNEIKNVVNSNETKVLLAVTDTAPAQCSTGDMYYDTTDDLIYTATGTNTWGSTGVAPTENTIYVVYSTQTAYAYDGDSLISVGGGTGSSDIVMVYPDTATAETKLYIEESDLNFQQADIESGSNANGNWIKYSDGTMICYREVTGSKNINTQWGSSLYYADITTEYTFAQEFISPPSVQLTVSPTSSTTFWQGYGDEVPIVTTTSYKNFALIRPTSVSGVGYRVKIFAIGKWK